MDLFDLNICVIIKDLLEIFLKEPFQNFGVIASFIGVIIILINVRHGRISQSAFLTIDYIEKGLTNNQDVINNIKKKKCFTYPNRNLDKFLDFLENVMAFQKQKIINSKHVDIELRYILDLMSKNNSIVNFINLTQEKEDKELYTLIQKRLIPKNWLVCLFHRLHL